MAKVAIVTGSYRNIGLEAVRGLLSRAGSAVYLTSRREEAGRAALSRLQGSAEPGDALLYHQLDVSDAGSVRRLADHLRVTNARVHVLINNAAVCYRPRSPRFHSTPLEVQVRNTLHTNYYGTLATCEALFPLLSPGARVVNVGSDCGLGFFMEAPEETQEKWKNVASVKDVTSLVEESAREMHKEQTQDHPMSMFRDAYALSKLGVMALTAVQQTVVDRFMPDGDVRVNCCSPGSVWTDLSMFEGQYSPEEGAHPVVEAATLDSESEIRGDFLLRQNVVKWRRGEISKEEFMQMTFG